MYALNEKVVYPGHGVAQVKSVIEKSVGSTKVKFYELKFLNRGITILIPVDSQESCGVRPLSTEAQVTELVSILERPAEIKRSSTTSSWNKRNKQYQYRIRTGDLIEIAKIYRDLQGMAAEKDLSFGERNLLTQIELLLAEEIALVKNIVEEQAIQILRSISRNKQANQTRLSSIQITW